MKNNYSIEDRGNYIEVRSSGIKDHDFGVRMWTDIVRVCNESDCFRVLGIANTTNPPQTWQALDLAEIMRTAGVSMKFRLAWVEQNPEALRGVKFYETVLRNRGLSTGRLFDDVETARQWLLDQPD